MTGIDDDSGETNTRRETTRSPRFLWWILVVRAVVVLALGASFLLSGRVHSVLGNLLASYWLIGALLTLRWVRANRGTRGTNLSLVAGTLGVAAAVLVLGRSLIRGVVSLNTALTVLGVTAIVTGVLRLVGAFHEDQIGDHPRMLQRFALGAIEVVLGVVFIAVDGLTRPVAVAGGVWALIGGTIMLFDAVAARNQSRASPESPG